MKFVLVCMLLASTAAISLAVPLLADSNDADMAMLESLAEGLHVDAAPAENTENTAVATLENVQEEVGNPNNLNRMTRFVRLQASQAHFQVAYVAVSTPDGKVVSEGKTVTSSCGSCGYPAAPSVIVNGKAEARNHPHQGSTAANPGSWHATGGLDWIEIDLGNDFPVAKVVFYNRLDCCNSRASGATLTLLNSQRETVDSATLNSDMMQIFDFKTCDIDMKVDSYKTKHSESVSPILNLLCGLQMKIRASQVVGAKEVATSTAIATTKKTEAEKAQLEYERANSAAVARAKDETNIDAQKAKELAMIETMVHMIHVLNGKELGNSATTPIADISQLVGRPSGFYFVKPQNEAAAVKVFVDNERNGGGWVLVARVTLASCQAHMTRAAVNLKSATEGPLKTDTVTVKMADSFIQNLRTSSSAAGNIGFWMEATDFKKDTFISSQATVDLEASANSMPQRTNVANSYSANGALSQRGPNHGTRGFGDHHTSGGTFFAWGRHPESCATCNCGFREDNLGASNGFLWVR